MSDEEQNKEEEYFVQFQDERVDLSPDRLKFNEANLQQWWEDEGAWIAYLGHKLVKAETIMNLRELDYDTKLAEKFKFFKNSGGSDKLAEASAKADGDVIAAKKMAIAAKVRMKRIQQHLRAWDRAHDNANNLGHTLRSEMNRLHHDLKLKQKDKFREHDEFHDMESQVEDMFNESDGDDE